MMNMASRDGIRRMNSQTSFHPLADDTYDRPPTRTPRGLFGSSPTLTATTTAATTSPGTTATSLTSAAASITTTSKSSPPTPTTDANKGQVEISHGAIRQDSTAFAALELLTKNSNEYNAILQLLVTKKAILMLPVSYHGGVELDRSFFEDHVVITQPGRDKLRLLSLSGIQGIIKKDQFIAIGLLPSERELTERLAHSDLSRRSIFDTFWPATPNAEGPNITILNSHVDIPWQPSNSGEAASLHVALIQKPISRKAISESFRALPGLSSRSNERGEGSPVPSEDSRGGTSAGGASPNASPMLLEEAQKFINHFRKRTPKTAEAQSELFQEFVEDLRFRLETSQSQLLSPSEGNDEERDEKEIGEKMEWVERYLATELYPILFSPPSSEDAIHDEALQSKIAALNILDLGLSHLGVLVADGETSRLEDMVRRAGAELQRMDGFKSPGEKLNVLVECHRVVVETLDKQTFLNLGAAQLSPQDLEPPGQDSHGTLQLFDLPTGDIQVESNEGPTDSPGISEEKKYSDTDNPIIPADEEGDHQPSENPPDPSSLEQPHSNAQDAHHSPTAPAPPPLPPRHPTHLSSADVLLPVLIYSVVKANPPHFVSNLRFIQRFRARTLLAGEAAYCLTNMMAVVAFLETTNLLNLGLSGDKVVSEPIYGFSSTSDTKPSGINLPQRVGQDLIGVAGGGLKVITGGITGVVDSSYKVFGRFLGGNYTETVGAAPQEAAAMVGGAVKELKELSTAGDTASTTSVESATGRGKTYFPIPFSVPVPFLETLQRQSSVADKPPVTPTTQLKQTSSSIPATGKHPPPLKRFLDLPSADEMRIKDIGELLSDYKRLAKIVQENGLC
ncbi:uncharacterized protein VTP21DRAFT_944 [Calcarisporiella thermophila]|uniref:uncharacterized protein n=1 Tax=Calcarisporiella thermophila TaxID=911321 RepID=UPI0037436A86